MESVKFKYDSKYFFEQPQLADCGCSGYDLYASFLDNEVKFINLLPGQRALIHTNLFLEIPIGYEAQVRSKSGLALKNGLMVLNSPGTIDASYRGECCVILYNSSNETFKIEEGMKIAQLVFQKVEYPQWIQDELNETSRGDGGFGSTGIR